MEPIRVLFQGDSITDANRVREDGANLGLGYPFFVASLFGADFPELQVNFLNRGISGDRVRDLKARWQEDCIDLKPDVLSILIGVNDTWRRFDQNDPTTAAEYERDYRYILDETKAKLPQTKLILLEPFLMAKPEDKQCWREDLDEKIHVVRRLAAEYGAAYIPLDGLFAEASMKDCPERFSADGVHPTPTGHAFIAQHWLDRVEF